MSTFIFALNMVNNSFTLIRTSELVNGKIGSLSIDLMVVLIVDGVNFNVNTEVQYKICYIFGDISTNYE